MFWRHLAFISILVTNCMAFKEQDMLCTDDYCTEYIKTKGCPTLSDACLIQNSTHNGVYLPYPDICNCCDYCVENLGLDEVCLIGRPGLPPPKKMCGPGLSCTVNQNKPATCQPMKTTCTLAQADYDERRKNGKVGMTEVRPKCDDDGKFAPAHCIPGSICYCISTEGKRIFGELPFSNPWDENQMTCGCSLNHWKALNTVDPLFIDVTLTARCNDYGLYDPLQCMMGDKADCVCVDPITGEPKIDTLIVPVNELQPGKPKCFDSSIHVTGTYETECERKKREWKEQSTTTTTTVASVRANEFVGPNCQPDGKYHRVQNLGTKRICVDPSGQQIENYETSSDCLPGSSTNCCNCARTRWLLKAAKITELPSCCSDGTFEAWQCRRNECFCVDENGDQVGVEVNENDRDKLCCYNNGDPCQVGSSSC